MKSQYDSFAEDFSQTRTKAWPEFDLLTPHVHLQDRVLDLGCGNGRLRQFLNTKIVPRGNYFGLDISNPLLKIARENFPKDHFFHGGFSEKLPFGDENFEVVTAIASFHHLLSKKEQLFFLSECHRVLKTGGTLFITTWKLPQKYFWRNILHGRLKNWIIPFGKDRHPRSYRRVDEKELAKLLKKSGFEVSFSRLCEERNYVSLGKKV